jgi:LEA14-like dessication related protein
MKKVKRKVSIVLIIIVVSVGLGYIFRKKLLAPFIPEVEQTSDIRIRIKNDTSFVSARLAVKNRSFLKIGIDTISYQVALSNKTYLQNTKSLGIQLPAFGSDTVDFSIKIPYVAILKDLKEERQKKTDSIGYSINITVGYSTIFGAAEMPVKKSAKLKIPQPPELEIEQIKWEKVRLKSIQATAMIKVINHNDIALSIKDIRYKMKISKEGVLKGDYKKLIAIKPSANTFIELPIEIDLNHIGKTLFNVLRNKDTYDYTLSLEATLETSHPLQESFHLDITKSGNIELKK